MHKGNCTRVCRKWVDIPRPAATGIRLPVLFQQFVIKTNVFRENFSFESRFYVGVWDEKEHETEFKFIQGLSHNRVCKKCSLAITCSLSPPTRYYIHSTFLHTLAPLISLYKYNYAHVTEKKRNVLVARCDWFGFVMLVAFYFRSSAPMWFSETKRIEKNWCMGWLFSYI